ncbi:MAG: hypothetical protein JWM44_4264 [Bacilli bacterium]|nr:hypothetical protein [Bacilli bacterium]
MKNITLKMLIISFMIGFGIFFGFDIATRGNAHNEVSAVNVSTNTAQNESPVNLVSEPSATIKPMTAATARQQAIIAQAAMIAKEQAKLKQQQAEPDLVLRDSFLNRLSNKIGDVLRRLGSGILHAIVGLFKLILG